MTTHKTKVQKEHVDKYSKLHIADKLTAIAGWVMNGDTDEQIAEKLKIGRMTLYNWKGKHPELAEALKSTKILRVGEVVHSAFKQAVGYDYYEDVIVKDGPDRQRVERVLKHQPPVPMLTMYMLNNKLPEDYKDRRNVDLTSKGNEIKPPINIQVVDLETKDLLLQVQNGVRTSLENNGDIQAKPESLLPGETPKPQ